MVGAFVVKHHEASDHLTRIVVLAATLMFQVAAACKRGIANSLLSETRRNESPPPPRGFLFRSFFVSAGSCRGAMQRFGKDGNKTNNNYIL